ncbi:MAG: LacI family DNA-binding transcriptional regulator [Mariniphaga sp.]|nr:LacI family DNA-binding transcriptional regulator [Mariniphaga sp.]
MERTKKITIQDVARYARVSAGTIDRVIHNRGRVSAEKRKKVEEAIKILNFNPNLLARTLALGKSFSVCALIPAAPSPRNYWNMPLQGIKTSAFRYMDFGMRLQYHFYDLFDESSFMNQAAQILESEPDGVILAPLFLHESKSFTSSLHRKGIPYIFIDADIPDGNSLSYIGPDVQQSACIAGKLMSTILPQKAEILILNMVKGFENASALQRMEKGFRDYFLKSGQQKNKWIHTRTIHSTQKEKVWEELEKFYEKYPGIQGVFVTNSNAFIVAEYHRRNALDIRLIGFDLVHDNIQQLKEGSIDYIISQSPVQQGERAIQTLFEAFIQKKNPEKIQHVPLDIIIQENLEYYIGFNQQYRFKNRKPEETILSNLIITK